MRVALILAAIVLSLFAQGTEWKSWNEARTLAKKNHKIIMLETVRDGCHYCEEMEHAVFEDPAMAALIQKRFIPVKIVINRQTVPLGIEVSMTPTFYFINGEQKVIKTVPGSWNREDFKTILGEVK